MGRHLWLIREPLDPTIDLTNGREPFESRVQTWRLNKPPNWNHVMVDTTHGRFPTEIQRRFQRIVIPNPSYNPPRRRRTQPQRLRMRPVFDAEVYEQVERVRWTRLPGSRRTGTRDQDFPYIPTRDMDDCETLTPREERDQELETNPRLQPRDYNAELFNEFQRQNRELRDFHEGLFRQVPGAQSAQSRHHALAHNNRQGMRAYRQQFGSGPEPFIGFRHFIDMFCKRHNIQDECPPTDEEREVTENLTDLETRWHHLEELGRRARLNGIPRLQIELMQFSWECGARPSGVAPHHNRGPIQLDSMDFITLLNLFRTIRTRRFRHHIDIIAQAFLSRCDGHLHLNHIRQEDAPERSGKQTRFGRSLCSTSPFN